MMATEDRPVEGRSGGSARPATVRHRLEYALVRLARLLDRLLRPRLAGGLGAALGRLAYRPLGIRADVVEDQLRRAFPEREAAWVRRTAAASYAHLGREAMSMLRLSRLEPADIRAVTRVDAGFEELRAAVEAGTGAIMVTGHFGNWEIGGAALAARGVPLDVVARRQANPLTDGLINAARERLGMRIIPRGSATRGSLRSLRSGRVVALVADQDAREAGIFIPFMGRLASTFRGPALLALRSGAPVFIGTAARTSDGSYRVRIRRIPPVQRADVEREDADGDAQVRELTARHVAALEEEVRARPEQYLWHHRRWKTRPRNGGGAGRYQTGANTP